MSEVMEGRPDAQPSGGHLERRLRARHVQLIAIGGTIGVGLFLGSAKAIQKAGPGLLLNYAIAGIAVFFIMRALGELLTYRAVAGAFSDFAEEFVSPFAGFATAWSYWLNWVVTGMAELTAIGIYAHYWFPQAPQWTTALLTLGILYGCNLLAVRIFGEIEFWFAVIKVLTIVALIVGGTAVIAFGWGEVGQTASVSHLWGHGGFFPFGILGVLLTLQMVTFAYSGVEMIAVTAGEAENPGVVLPRAIDSVIARILLFHIGALVVVMSLVPWDQLSPTLSPFVVVFERMGLPAAAHIINIVVITAAASSCNSGIYCTGRQLYSLGVRGQAPAMFSKLNQSHVPANAVHASAAVMLIGVCLNVFVPESVFTWVTSIALVGTLWTWAVIMLAHRSYRKAVAAGAVRAVNYRMPGTPVANWLVIGFVIVVTAMLALDAQTRVALYVAPIWFVLLVVGYRTISRREHAICHRIQR